MIVDVLSLVIYSLALAVAIAAAWYARREATAAWHQIELTERARREALEPYVVVDLQPSAVSRKFLNLVIENVGQTVARNVRFKFEPSLRSTGDKAGFPIMEAKLIRNGVPTLPPGRRIEIFFDSIVDRQDALDHTYRVQVDAEGPFGSVETMVYELDVLLMWNSLHASERTIHHGVEAVEAIRDELGKVRRVIEAWREN